MGRAGENSLVELISAHLSLELAAISLISENKRVKGAIEVYRTDEGPQYEVDNTKTLLTA